MPALKRQANREDPQTWRDRLINKRIITSNPEVATHDSWKIPDPSRWEPRIYFCEPSLEGLDKNLAYKRQTHSRLLMLPAEIRNYILSFVLPPEEAAFEKTGEGPPQTSTVWINTSAIIFCCKQLYAEGRPLALQQHTFDWSCFPKKTRLCGARRDTEYWIFDL
jgi:hypothetical protein